MIKNIMKVLLSNVVVLLMGLVNSFVFPLLLSINGYAMYQKYILYVLYVNICQLGITSGMFIKYGGEKYDQIDKESYKSEIYLLTIVLSIFTIVGLAIYLIKPSFMLLMIVLSIFPVCMVGSYKALYQAWSRFTEYSIINVLSTIALTLASVSVYILTKELISEVVILIYLGIQMAFTAYFAVKFFTFSNGVRSKYLFSQENFQTAKSGFILMIGNYIGLLFYAMDKQFVNLFFSTYSFAMYSFAISTNSVMMIFITAFSHPFYPFLAKDNTNKEKMNMYKELLFMFGTFSGCAYFVVAYIVNNYITKYTDSLEVVSIFFAVFPALAVINVLYVNLYKVNKKLKEYIIALSYITILAFVLNGLFVIVWKNFIGVSIATIIVYYIWLIYSQRDLENIRIVKKDYIYLLIFMCNYFICVWMMGTVLGLVIYTIVNVFLNLIMYKTTTLMLMNTFSTKVKNMNFINKND